MTKTPLGQVVIRGFTSIRELTLDLPTDVTVLIGANGAGKSNIVQALELLGRIVDRQLQTHLLKAGGFHQLLHRAEPTTQAIQIEAWDAIEPLGHGYRAELTAAAGDRALLVETGLSADRRLRAAPRKTFEHQGSESQLDTLAKVPGGGASRVTGLLHGCRVYHFHDTSSDAPMKRRADVADNLTLTRDGANVASVLLRLRVEDPTAYQRIRRSVQVVAPFFDDFSLEPLHDSVLLAWSQKGVDGTFSADRLSDGTLRFLCLAVALLHPRRPVTVVFDEPELGLHPFAIHQLASLLRAGAGHGRRVILATQSVPLLSAFTPEEIQVVERHGGATTVQRLDLESLDQWLTSYSLGELWEKNLLGGRPTAEAR